MIKLLRVDHRLLHGQVAFSWKNAVEADCILIACDAVMKDDLTEKLSNLTKEEQELLLKIFNKNEGK
mgnify:CR=1 FL=1